MAVIPTPEEKSKYHFIVQPKPVHVKMTPETITVAAAVGKQAVDKASQGDVSTAGSLLVAAGAIAVGAPLLPAMAVAGFSYWLLGGFKNAATTPVPTAAPTNNNAQTVVNNNVTTNTNASPPGFIGKQNVNTMTQSPPITTFQTQKEMQQFANHNTSKDHRSNNGVHNCTHCAAEDKTALAREEERLARERKALMTPPVTVKSTAVQEAPKTQNTSTTSSEKQPANTPAQTSTPTETKVATSSDNKSTASPEQSNSNTKKVAGDRPKTETRTGKSRNPQNKGAVPPIKMPNNNGNGNNNQKPPEKKPEKTEDYFKKPHNTVEPPHYEKSPRTERIEFKKDAQIRDNYDQMPDGTLKVKANARNPLKTKDGKIIHAIKIDVVDKNRKPIDGFDSNGQPIAAIEPHSKTPFPPLPGAQPLNGPSGQPSSNPTPKSNGPKPTKGTPFPQKIDYEAEKRRKREEEETQKMIQSISSWGQSSNQNSIYAMEQEYNNRFKPGGYYDRKQKEEEEKEKAKQAAWRSRTWNWGE